MVYIVPPQCHSLGDRCDKEKPPWACLATSRHKTAGSEEVINHRDDVDLDLCFATMVQSVNTKALMTLASIMRRPGLMVPHVSVSNISEVRTNIRG